MANSEPLVPIVLLKTLPFAVQKKSIRVAKKLAQQAQEEIEDDDTEYCICRQLSYGKMVMCDNPGCEYVWFHFPCVGLRAKPRGDWYCPKCRSTIKKTKKAKTSSSA